MNLVKKTPVGSECLSCGAVCDYAHDPGICFDCGHDWFDPVYDYEESAADFVSRVEERERNMWRYGDILPLKDEVNIVTLSEGWTPLYSFDGPGDLAGLNNLFVKDERRNPTGSFKDRQASLKVSMLRESGIDEFVVCTTGNVAVSYAAYSARAGIKVWIFMPAHAQKVKMSESQFYGANVVKVLGTYDEAKQVAASFALERGLHLDGGTKGIANRECMKTIALEICEQLGWKAPDWYVQAVSGGMGPLGAWKGFYELYRMGITDKVPGVVCVQPDGCAPMARAFENDDDEAEPVVPDTRISMLSTGNPGFAYTLMRRRQKESAGIMCSVSDEDAFEVLDVLAKSRGMFVAPAAAVAFAGTEKLAREGKIARNDAVVVNCSGMGPRWPDILCEPEMQEVKYNGGDFDASHLTG